MSTHRRQQQQPRPQHQRPTENGRVQLNGLVQHADGLMGPRTYEVSRNAARLLLYAAPQLSADDLHLITRARGKIRGRSMVTTTNAAAFAGVPDGSSPDSSISPAQA